MKASAEREEIEEIRRRLDAVALVSEVVPLKKAGKSYKGRCPFHNEKTPSFYLNPTTGLYKCFGCGKAGDVFRFVMEIHNMTFPEALDHLARRAGVTRRRHKKTPANDKRARMRQACEEAAAYYEKALAAKAGEAARAYLADRGVLQETARRFRLGFAPRQGRALAAHLAKKKIPLEIAAAAGLVRPQKHGKGWYDFFRGRLVFPIRDVLGGVVGFGGRTIAPEDKGPKYINTAETEVYRKSAILYGLHEGRDAIAASRRAVLVEGYLDVLLLHQAGLEEAVAPLGTAFTEEQARELRRRAEAVVVLLDADAAGDRAAARAIELCMAAGLEVRVARLAAGKDPADLVASGAFDEVRAAIDKASDAAKFLLTHVVRPDGTAVGRARAAEEMARLLAGIDDPLVRDAQVRDTALELGLGEEALRDRVAHLRRRGGVSGRGDDAPRGEVAASAPPVEARAVRLAALDAAARQYAADARLAPEDFSDPTLAAIFAAILAASEAGEAIAGDLGGRLSEEAVERFAELLARDEPTGDVRAPGTDHGTEGGREAEDAVRRMREMVRRIKRRRIDEAIRAERDPVRIAELVAEKRRLLAGGEEGPRT